MTIPTLTDTVDEPVNQWHEQILQQTESPAVEVKWGERPSNELADIEWDRF